MLTRLHVVECMMHDTENCFPWEKNNLKQLKRYEFKKNYVGERTLVYVSMCCLCVCHSGRLFFLVVFWWGRPQMFHCWCCVEAGAVKRIPIPFSTLLPTQED